MLISLFLIQAKNLLKLLMLRQKNHLKCSVKETKVVEEINVKKMVGKNLEKSSKMFWKWMKA